MASEPMSVEPISAEPIVTGRSLATMLLRRDRPVRLLVAAYVVLNLLDLLTTYLAILHGAHELSPVYAQLFEHWPFAVGAIVRLLGTVIGFLFAVVLACGRPSPYSRAALRLYLAVFCFILTIAVLNNLHTLTIVLH